MRFFKVTASICLLLALGAGSIFFRLRSPGVEVRRVEFQSLNKENIVGDYYLPANRKGRLPGVLLCHGVEANKEIMGHLGVELARRGFAALAFDYGGYGESDPHNDEFSLMVLDTFSALRFMYLQPETLGEGHVALVGHSMGVSYSVGLAEERPDVVAVVGLGNQALTDTVPPRNVMLAMGVYDAFHTLPDMLETVRESARNPGLKPNETAGDFKSGTARALVTSPYCDHGIEPVDPLLMSKTIEWILKSMPEVQAPALKIRETYRAQARLVMFAAGGTAFTALLVLLIVPASFSGNGRRPAHLMRRLHFIVVIPAAVIGNIAGPSTTLACTDVFLAALISGSIAGALYRTGLKSDNADGSFASARAGLMKGIGFTLLIVGCLLAALLVNGLPTAYSLGYLPRVPAFLFYILLLRPYEGLCMLRAYGFYRYSEALVPGIVLGVMIAGELVRPGVIFEIISRIANTVIKAFGIKGPFKLQSSRAGVAGAVAVFAGLAFILYKRFEEGWLSGEAVRKMFWISLKFMILPLLLFILIVNIAWRSGEEVDSNQNKGDEAEEGGQGPR